MLFLRMVLVCVLCGLLQAGSPAQAGTLARADVARRFPAPLVVGERAADIPAWPLFRQDGAAMALAGCAFESIDLAPVPGFAGVPLNLLVVIDPQGRFLDVAVLSHHEPVFLEGLGEAPLQRFVQQYRGLSLAQGIVIDGARLGTGNSGDARLAHLDGMSEATASVRIINQSILAAALQGARARLGFAAGRDPGRLGQVRADLLTPMSLRRLLDAGLVRHVRLLNRDAERLFAGSDGAGLDPQALATPDEVFIDLYFAWASVPGVGRNLLAQRSWRRLQARLEPGDQALLVMASGRHAITGEDFVRGSVPQRIVLRQDRLPVEMRDLDLDPELAPEFDSPVTEALLLRVIAQAGLDPARALDVGLPVTRSKGIVYPERITREINFGYRLPQDYYQPPPAAAGSAPAWAGWQARRLELALLTVALLRQKRLAVSARRFTWLLFTIVFIGHAAQAQLSIVNLTGIVQALRAGRGLGFLLFDPMTATLWAFVLLALLLSAALVELEPFKTAVTLGFVRAWPYVAYAAGLLALAMVVHKGFCRYLCPLGAALALLGRVRMLDWIPRRVECGAPCQTCRHRCGYNAIAPDGRIDYGECFQCMECVVIHESDAQCAPRILERKHARTIAIVPARYTRRT